MTRQRVRRRVRPRVARRFSLAGFLRASFCLAALAGVGVILGYWLLTSPRFAVARVEVRGTSTLAEPEILAAAGITAGENLLRVNPETVAVRLEGVPGVRRAQVIRELPNRVTLVVEERQPFTLTHVGRLHWLDEEGVLLAAEPRAVTPALPLVSGLLPEELGSRRTPASDRVMAAIGLLRTLLRSGSPLLSRLSEIDASRPDSPVFYTVDGTEIRLGSEPWEEQLALLEGLLDEISSWREPVEYVDLRFKDQVVFKPRMR
jgi:cell division septal protein FtsQ